MYWYNAKLFEQEESPFANRNGFAGSAGGFDADPFGERTTTDPFAPAGGTIAQVGLIF